MCELNKCVIVHITLLTFQEVFIHSYSVSNKPSLISRQENSTTHQILTEATHKLR